MTETVHVGEGGRKSKVPRWQFVLLLIVVIVVAAGVGALVRRQTTKDSVNKTRGRDLPAVVDDVQNMRAGGNPEEAKKKIDAAINNPDTSNDIKYQLYIQQGSLAKENGSLPDAIVSYEKAAAIKMTYEAASLLGRTYALAGDKAKAISWYKKAIPAIPTEEEGNFMHDVDQEDMEEAIRSLGGQP